MSVKMPHTLGWSCSTAGRVFALRADDQGLISLIPHLPPPLASRELRPEPGVSPGIAVCAQKPLNKKPVPCRCEADGNFPVAAAQLCGVRDSPCVLSTLAQGFQQHFKLLY